MEKSKLNNTSVHLVNSSAGSKGSSSRRGETGGQNKCHAWTSSSLMDCQHLSQDQWQCATVVSLVQLCQERILLINTKFSTQLCIKLMEGLIICFTFTCISFLNCDFLYTLLYIYIYIYICQHYACYVVTCYNYTQLQVD